MEKIIDLLKKIFANEPDKIKVLEDYRLDESDAENLKEMQKILGEISGKRNEEERSNSDIKNIIASLTEQVRAMQAIIAEQAKKQEEREQAIAEEAKKAHQKKIADTIEKAIKEGKIPAKNEQELARWKALFEKDYEAAEFALSKIEAAKTTQEQSKVDDKIESKFGSVLRPEFAKYVENIPINEN